MSSLRHFGAEVLPPQPHLQLIGLIFFPRRCLSIVQSHRSVTDHQLSHFHFQSFSLSLDSFPCSLAFRRFSLDRCTLFCFHLVASTICQSKEGALSENHPPLSTFPQNSTPRYKWSMQDFLQIITWTSKIVSETQASP